eukprot:g878.t1
MASEAAAGDGTSGDGTGCFHAWQWDSADHVSGTLHRVEDDDWLAHVRVGAEEGRRRAMRSLRAGGADSPYVHARCADEAGRRALHYAAANGDAVLVRALVELGGESADVRDRAGTSAAAFTLAAVKNTAEGLTPGHVASMQFLRRMVKTGAFERRQLIERGRRSARKKRAGRRRRGAGATRSRGDAEEGASESTGARESTGAGEVAAHAAPLLPPIPLPAPAAPAPVRARGGGAAAPKKLSGVCKGSLWSSYYSNTCDPGARRDVEFGAHLQRRDEAQLREWRQEVERRTLGIVPGEPTSPDRRVTGMPVERTHYPLRS